MLNEIDFPKDIKNMDEKALKQLAKEIRYFLIKNVLDVCKNVSANISKVRVSLLTNVGMRTL